MLIVINSYQNLHPGAKLDNFETPKDYIRMVAYAIDGRYGDAKACLRTVRQYWKNTTAALDREGQKVEQEIINSTTNVSTLLQFVILFTSPTYQFFSFLVHRGSAPEGDEPSTSEACKEVRVSICLPYPRRTTVGIRLA